MSSIPFERSWSIQFHSCFGSTLSKLENGCSDTLSLLKITLRCKLISGRPPDEVHS